MTCLASLAGCDPCYEWLAWLVWLAVSRVMRLAGLVWLTISCVIKWSANRWFPEITGEDNLTVFSDSGRVKSPEWRWQRRRADLRHFEIFRHGPIIIYIRLPTGGTYYPICTFPASSECLIGISDAFSAFCLRVSVTDLPHVLTVPPTKACLLCATLMMSWCLMSSDVIWHIRDKLWPMPKHGSIKATYVRCMRV